MKIGLVGYQNGGKSTVFELLTGTAPDPSKMQSGQSAQANVPDERYDKLIELHNPKKEVPPRIELFDTPGLNKSEQAGNAQRLGVIREAAGLVQVIGVHTGVDPLEEVDAFETDKVLADLQSVGNRMEKLEKDVTKPRPDRDDLKAELEALQPVHAKLDAGESLLGFEFSELQEQVCKSFSLLTRKPGLVVLNTADSDIDAEMVSAVEAKGVKAVAAPVGLELEVAALPDDERAMFAEEMGLGEPCRERLLRAIFEVTNQITFYTSGEKEVHAWLLRRGSTVLEAAHSIHSDLARGFVRAEVWPVDELLRLGSERELKAAGVNQVIGKEYIVQDGDEVFIRANV